MSDPREEKIRAMQEKGTITKEQAEELLAALREQPERAPEQETPRAETSGEGAPHGDTPHAEREERRGRRRWNRSGDWDWGWDWDWARHAHRGDSTWWSGGNAQNFSRVEQPEGESFE
ncbi:MAG TPA: hypothetical protein VMU36_06185, partial [Spirochaetia bacterium]|nr:hypothetical protein [Spirochaetia bacterium]